MELSAERKVQEEELKELEGSRGEKQDNLAERLAEALPGVVERGMRDSNFMSVVNRIQQNCN